MNEVNVCSLSHAELPNIESVNRSEKTGSSVNPSTVDCGEYVKEIIGGDKETYELFKRNKNGTRQGRVLKFVKGKLCEETEYHDGEMINKNKEIVDDVLRIYDRDGVMVYQGGFLIDNDFNCIRNGEGKEYDNNVISYVGNWKNGKKEGNGKSIRNGRVYYVGSWLNDVPDGKGRLMNEKNEIVYEGIWIDGDFRINSHQVFHYLDGSILESPVDSLEVKVSKEMEWFSLSSLVTSIQVAKNSCNTLSSLECTFFPALDSLIISNNCFQRCHTVVFQGLPELKSIKIGCGCFTSEEEISCVFKQCSSLKEITIDPLSFVNGTNVVFEGIIGFP